MPLALCCYCIPQGFSLQLCGVELCRGDGLRDSQCPPEIIGLGIVPLFQPQTPASICFAGQQEGLKAIRSAQGISGIE